MAKKDVLSLTEEYSETAPPKKMTMPLARQLEEVARKQGLGDLPDNETPGKVCLTRLYQNHAPGVLPKYLHWEIYTSVEDEKQAERAGMKMTPTMTFKSVPEEGVFKAVQEGRELRRKFIEDEVALMEALTIRAHAAATTEVVPLRVYEELNRVYFRALRSPVPQRMRRPTHSTIKYKQICRI